MTGIIDRREIVHRQLIVGQDAEDNDRRRQQHRHDRPLNERPGEAGRELHQLFRRSLFPWRAGTIRAARSLPAVAVRFCHSLGRARLASPPASLGGGCASSFTITLVPGRKLQLAADHDVSPGCTPSLMTVRSPLLLSRLHLAEIERGVLFHDKNVGAVLADLDGAIRDELRVFDRVEDQSDMHKLRRPERVVWVRRDGAGLRRSGSRLQGIGHEIKAAFARRECCPPPHRSAL